MDAKQLLAHLALARALSQNAQPAEAEREARIAVELSPAQADAHYELGYALVRGGNPEGAIQEFRKSVEMEPGSVRNRTGLAVAYAASIGEFDAADRTFQEALQLDPRNAALLGDIQFVKQLRARLSRQLEAAQTMVRLHPESGPAHDSEALLLLRLGIRERAITEVREALKLSPGTWSPHYTLALALYANHDYVGSRAALADAQKLGAGVKPFLEQSLHTAEARQLTK
jgi:Flp pilus assembly protein TadD